MAQATPQDPQSNASLDDERPRAVDDADIRSATSRQEELDALVASSDTGGRSPSRPVAILIAATALCWSLFQLWFASPFPFMLRIGVFNDTEARSIHLAFAIFLAFLVFPPARGKFQMVLGVGIPIVLGALFLTGATGVLPVWYLPLVVILVVAAVVLPSPNHRVPLNDWAAGHRGRGRVRRVPLHQLRGHLRPRRRARTSSTSWSARWA